MDVPALLAKVTWAWEVATDAKAACVMAMVAVETFAQEAATVLDSTALCVKDA
jgi:hypothetical protein